MASALHSSGNVTWSDESSFSPFPRGWGLHVWPMAEAYSFEYCIPTVKILAALLWCQVPFPGMV